MTSGLFSVLALLLGLLSLGRAIWLYLNGTRARAWPVVQGTVTHMSVKEVPRGEADASEHGGPQYLPVVEYEYKVRTRSYRGNRIVFGEMNPMAQHVVAEFLRPYSVGSKVWVHHDPMAPQISVLHARVHGFSVFMYGLIGILLLAALVYGNFFAGMR
jgi:hypothetical protein